MKAVTVHLEMSDEDAAAFVDEACELADADDVTRMALALKPTYRGYLAKVIAIGSVPA